MTREEAIKMLKSKMDGHTDTSYEWAETVRMAIKALEQEPCEDANANQHNSNTLNFIGQRINALEGDVISRQAAIRIAEQGQVQGYEWQFKELNKLPPATPQLKTGHWIEHEIKGICRWLTCSVCGYEWVNKKENFCPNCGSVMVEPQERSDKE
jgi:rubrerythrin